MFITILGILLSLLGMGTSRDVEVKYVAPVVQEVTTIEEDAYDDAWCEFTNLFNSYETKWSKNGRLMLKTPSSKSFKFVAKGK